MICAFDIIKLYFYEMRFFRQSQSPCEKGDGKWWVFLANNMVELPKHEPRLSSVLLF